MTSTIKVTSHNYPVRVETYDLGVRVDEVHLRPADGERTFYTTTTRELRITDLEMDALLPHQQRVANEQADLAAKIGRLTQFINGPRLEALPPLEQKRLVEQLGIMTQYNAILLERIGAFKGEGE